MNTLIETYHRLLSELIPTYHRKFYDDFTLDSRLVGVVGARGVGKTTFLLEYLRKNYGDSSQALYISADNLYFVEHTLYQVVDQFVKEYDGKIICIDEIHRYKNWNQELKNIYDSYPKLSIIFSGSSSIDLVKGKYDLSRRVVLKNLYGFSFREFLEIKVGKSYPIIGFDELVKDNNQYDKIIAKIPKLLGYFKEYLKAGYYPTFLELKSYSAYSQSLKGVIDKIIYQDISSIYSINTSNLDVLRKIVYFFATSTPGSINVNRLAQSLKKDYTTIAGYVQILRDTGILRFLIQNKHGHALVRDTEKIYLDNPNLLHVLNAEIGLDPGLGMLRELYVIANLQNANYHPFYSMQGDIECGKVFFEIGGKSKTFSQLSKVGGFIIKDDILIGDSKTIPLYLFGFLY